MTRCFYSARHEPAENELLSRANDALDEIERYVRTVIDAGGEHALRQRLAHLLPPSAKPATKGRRAQRTGRAA